MKNSITPIIQTHWCYQETANISTSCGGLASGKYSWVGSWSNPLNVIDENLTTPGLASVYPEYFYINYSRPQFSTNLSLIKVVFTPNNPPILPINLSIPQNCWVQIPLQFREKFGIGVFPQIPYDEFSCYNGSSWKFLDSGFRANDFYEEAMWWKISN